MFIAQNDSIGVTNLSVGLQGPPCWNIPARTLLCNGPLTRYVKLRVAHAPGMPRTFSPPLTSKETARLRSRHASRHVREARVVMHVGIAYPWWWGKHSRHSRRMRNPQFYVSGKRPMDCPVKVIPSSCRHPVPGCSPGCFSGLSPPPPSEPWPPGSQQLKKGNHLTHWSQGDLNEISGINFQANFSDLWLRYLVTLPSDKCYWTLLMMSMLVKVMAWCHQTTSH